MLTLLVGVSALLVAPVVMLILAKREPGKNGLQELTVRNRSGQPLELVPSWNFPDKARANVGLAPVPGEFVLPATLRKIFCESCHQPPEATNLKVGPGETVRVLLPCTQFGDFDKKCMVLLLTEKNGKVVKAGRLFPEAGKGEEE